MGANMVVEAVVEYGDRPENERRAAMHAALAELPSGSLEDCSDLWEELGYAPGWVNAALGRETGATHLEDAGDDWPSRLPVDEQRALVARVIDEYFETLGSRDVSFIVVLGIQVNVTGGMFWGDDTPVAQAFRRFNMLPVTLLEVGGFFNPHETFLARLIADYPDKLPEPVRRVLDSWRVLLAL